MDHYVYLTSDDSKAYFSDNAPYNFRVHLTKPLILKGFWKVSLVEFYAQVSSKVKNAKQTLYVYCDFCKESTVSGELQPILRRLTSTKNNRWAYSFDSDFYLPLTKHHIYEMNIYIKMENGELATQLNNPLMITLHFKHYPFFL